MILFAMATDRFEKVHMIFVCMYKANQEPKMYDNLWLRRII